MADYNDLIPEMLENLPKCEVSTALTALYRVGREFCKRTKAWQEDLDAIDAVADQAEYTLTTIEDAMYDRLVSVKLNGTDYTPYEYKAYKFLENTRLIFNSGYIPTEDITDGIEVTAILVPNYGSNILPDWFIDKYSTGLIAGASYNLMISAGKPYTNPDLAGVYRGIYRYEINRAMNDLVMGNTHRQTTLSG